MQTMQTPAGGIVVWVGSPRKGVCERVALRVADEIRACGLEAHIVRIADFDIEGCCGCGVCADGSDCYLETAKTQPGAQSACKAQRPGFKELLECLMSAEGLVLLAPLYFAGPPAQLKAAFDRFQVLWSRRYVLGTRPVLKRAERKPLDIVVVGEGGDEFGYDPLVTCARSALRMADFELQDVIDLVGLQGSPQLEEQACERACTEVRALVHAVEALRMTRSGGM